MTKKQISSIYNLNSLNYTENSLEKVLEDSFAKKHFHSYVEQALDQISVFQVDKILFFRDFLDIFFKKFDWNEWDEPYFYQKLSDLQNLEGKKFLYFYFNFLFFFIFFIFLYFYFFLFFLYFYFYYLIILFIFNFLIFFLF